MVDPLVTTIASSTHEIIRHNAMSKYLPLTILGQTPETVRITNRKKGKAFETAKASFRDGLFRSSLDRPRVGSSLNHPNRSTT